MDTRWALIVLALLVTGYNAEEQIFRRARRNGANGSIKVTADSSSPTTTTATTTATGNSDQCPENVVETVAWPATVAGKIAVGSCPPGSQGQASRACCGHDNIGRIDSEGHVCQADAIGSWMSPSWERCETETISAFKEMGDAVSADAVVQISSSLASSLSGVSTRIGSNDVVIAMELLGTLCDTIIENNIAMIQDGMSPFMENVIHIVNSLSLAPSDSLREAYGMAKRKYSLIPSTLSRLLHQFVDEIAAGATLSTAEWSIVEDNLIFHVHSPAANSPAFQGWNWPPQSVADILTKAQRPYTKASIPGTALDGLTSSGVIGVIQYDSGTFFLGEQVAVTGVLSVVVQGLEEDGGVAHMNDKITFTMQHHMTGQQEVALKNQINNQHSDRNMADVKTVTLENGDGQTESKITYSYRTQESDSISNDSDDIEAFCSWWDYRSVKWRSDGCTVAETNGDSIVCECDHLTDFAVTVTGGDPITAPMEDLSFVFYTGAVTAVVFLTLLIILFIVFWREKFVRTQEHIVMNLAFALIGANISFVIGARRASGVGDAGCEVTALLTHYFLLVACCWILAQGVTIFMDAVKILPHALGLAMFMRRYFVIAWLFPGIALFISVMRGRANTYTENYCWFDMSSNIIVAFIIPVALILTTHLLFLLLGVVKRRNPLHMPWKENILLVALLCAAWAMASLIVESNDKSIQLVFAIMTALHAIFLFYHHIIQNGEVYDATNRITGCKYYKQMYTIKLNPGKSGKGISPTKTPFKVVQRNSTLELNIPKADLDSSRDVSVVRRGSALDSPAAVQVLSGGMMTPGSSDKRRNYDGSLTPWENPKGSFNPAFAAGSVTATPTQKNTSLAWEPSPVVPATPLLDSPAQESWTQTPEIKGWMATPRRERENPFDDQTRTSSQVQTPDAGVIITSSSMSKRRKSPQKHEGEDAMEQKRQRQVQTPDVRLTIHNVDTDAETPDNNNEETYQKKGGIKSFFRNLALTVKNSPKMFSSPSLQATNRRSTTDLIDYYKTKAEEDARLGENCPHKFEGCGCEKKKNQTLV